MSFKTIHQTWDDNAVPECSIPWTQSWKSNHPDWEYKLWSNEEGRDLIKDKFSWFLPVYDGYDYNIQRADAIRYFILYQFGGLYCDLDIWCAKNITELISGECTLFAEHPDHSLQEYFLSKPVYTNSIFYSKPKGRFMKKIIHSLQAASNFKQREDLNPDTIFSTRTGTASGNPMTVVMSTGPGILTSTYYKYRDILDINVQSHERFEHCSKYERHNKLTNQDMSIPDSAFGLHWMIGSWIVTENTKLKYKFRDK